MSQKLSIKLKY